MLQFGVGSHLPVDGPLERDLLVGSHPGVPRNGGSERFKVHEAARILYPGQFLGEDVADPWPTGLHGGTHPRLRLGEREIVGDLFNQRNALIQKLLHAEPRQMICALLVAWDCSDRGIHIRMGPGIAGRVRYPAVEVAQVLVAVPAAFWAGRSQVCGLAGTGP